MKKQEYLVRRFENGGLKGHTFDKYKDAWNFTRKGDIMLVCVKDSVHYQNDWCVRQADIIRTVTQ